MSKNNPLDSLKKALIALWHNCKDSNEWKPDYTNQTFWNTLQLFNEEPRIRGVYDFEVLSELLIYRLNDDKIKQKSNFDYKDSDELINAIYLDLSANLADHLIVIPINYAVLKKSFSFGNFYFITGSRKSKIKKLAKLIGITEEKMNYRASHTEKSRSPSFFKKPLLVVKLNKQTGSVEYVARSYALWLQCAILSLYWAYIQPKSIKDRFGFSMTDLDEATHLSILANDDWRWSHQPLNFSIPCKMELDWLNNNFIKKQFTSLFESIISNTDKDPLYYRFYRALRYFGKAIEVEENRDAFEGMGLTITFLMIAAEGICFLQSQEIRSRLTVYLPELSKLGCYTSKEKANAVENAYRWRSDYVHDGTDKYIEGSRRDQSLSEVRNMNILKSMIAKIICESPMHINKMITLKNSPTDKLDTIWFNEINKYWKKKLDLI